MDIQEQNPIINWRIGCVSEFESLWSILHKVCYLNSVHGADIKRIFGNDVWHRENPSNWGRDEGRLLRFGYLNPELLAKCLNIDQGSLRFSTIDEYWFPYLPTDKVTSKTLRYCPTCISRGFHSPLYQFEWLKYCPIHNDKLVKTCPECGEFLSYSFPDLSTPEAYGCQCGYSLWKERDSKTWGILLDNIENIIFGTYFTSRDSVNDNFLNNMGFRKEIFLAGAEDNLLEIPGYFSDAKLGFQSGWGNKKDLLHRSNKVHFHVYCGLPALKDQEKYYQPREDVDMNKSYFDYSNGLNNQLNPNGDIEFFWRTYCSLRRKLQQIICVHHKGCLNNLTDLTNMFGVSLKYNLCPKAYAFIIWRRYWEGKNSDQWSKVRFGHVSQGMSDHASRYTTIAREIFFSRLIFPDINSRLILINWLSTRIFAIDLLNTFVESLELSNNAFGSMQYPDLVPKLGENPDAAYLKIRIMNLTEIHCWSRSSIHDIQKELVADKVHRHDVIKNIKITRNNMSETSGG